MGKNQKRNTISVSYSTSSDNVGSLVAAVIKEYSER